MNKAIKDLDIYISDGNYSSKYPRSDEFVERGIPFIRANNMFDGTIVDEDMYYITPEKHSELKKGHVKTGDVLITTRGNIGQVAVVPAKHEDSNINAQIVLLRTNESTIYNRYLLWALQTRSVKEQFVSLQTGTALKQLPVSRLEQVVIPMVDIIRQYKIAHDIDRIYKLIKARRQQIELFDNLIKARFVETFGERGKVVPLTDYVWFQEGPGVRSVDFAENGTILLTGSNINDNEISFGYKSDRFISNDLASGKYAHFICDKDDILVVSSAIAPEKFDKKVTIVKEDKKYCLNTGIIRFKPNLEVMTLGYFREFLKTEYFKHQVMAEMRGIAQMHFGPSHLKQMTILLPESIEQQIEFEKFVEQVDKSKVAVQRSLDEAQLLFDSLMQEYFG